MYKIFIGNLALYLMKEAPEKFQVDEERVQVILYSKDTNLLSIIELAEANESEALSAIYILNDDVNDLFSDFCRHYKLIDAAGGLVFNEKQEALFIFRLGKWDLPKGKAEKDETIKETAVREVEEETGLEGVKIESEIVLAANQKNATYHTYRHFRTQKRVLKTTYWYKMSASKSASIKPQTEEGIEALEWVAKEKMADCLANTYGSIADVVRASEWRD